MAQLRAIADRRESSGSSPLRRTWQARSPQQKKSCSARKRPCSLPNLARARRRPRQTTSPTNSERSMLSASLSKRRTCARPASRAPPTSVSSSYATANANASAPFTPCDRVSIPWRRRPLSTSTWARNSSRWQISSPPNTRPPSRSVGAFAEAQVSGSPTASLKASTTPRAPAH